MSAIGQYATVRVMSRILKVQHQRSEIDPKQPYIITVRYSDFAVSLTVTRQDLLREDYAFTLYLLADIFFIHLYFTLYRSIFFDRNRLTLILGVNPMSYKHNAHIFVRAACTLGLFLLLTACSGGGSSSNTAQGNQWDQMQWDQGTWG